MWTLEALTHTYEYPRYYLRLSGNDTSIGLLSMRPVSENDWQHVVFSWGGSILNFYFNVRLGDP